MNKPNFFIIGEPKCGTTIIHDYLAKHQDIFMSNPKELNYFNFDHYQESVNFHWKYKANLFYKYINKSDYLNIFKNTENYKIKGESSVSYAYSKIASENIFNFDKKTKIIYFLREPLSLLISFHWQLFKSTDENEADFLKALNLEKRRKKWLKNPKNSITPSGLFYTEWIKFSEHLQRYLDYFPTDQIKVIIYEEFKKDNQKTIDEIIDFLEVERIKIEHKKVNISAYPRFKFIRTMIRLYPVKFITQKILPSNWRNYWSKIIDKLTLKEGKKTILPENEKIKLMKQFKKEVVKINYLLHKNDLIDKEMDLVKYWGYDKI